MSDLSRELREAAERLIENSAQTDQLENKWSYGPVICCDPSAWFALQDVLAKPIQADAAEGLAEENKELRKALRLWDRCRHRAISCRCFERAEPTIEAAVASLRAQEAK